MPRYSSVMPRGQDHAERVHPTLILLVLSLAGLSYAILSSAVIPALPTLEHDLHTTETGVTWLLTGFLLSASEEHTSELQSHVNLVCRLLLEKKNEATATRESVAGLVSQ